MRALILGGAGFVGRRFSRRLANQRNDVTVVDNLVAGQHPMDWAFPPDDWSKVNFIERDCREFFKHHSADEWDLVIHCAAIVGGRLNIDGDPLAVATDLAIDADFFNWAVRGRDLPKVVYFSSSAVYPLELQTRETHCQLAEALVSFRGSRISFPDKTYGWAKMSGEYLAHFAADVYGLDTAIYRPFGGYGEDQDFNYPFPSIIRRILNKEDPVVVWGSGEQRRDFIYIEDVIDAVLGSYETLHADTPLNLGTGYGTSFLELAQMACDVLDYDAALANDPTKPEGVFSRVADASKLQQRNIPQTMLHTGIKKVADFLRKPKLRLMDEGCSTQRVDTGA